MTKPGQPSEWPAEPGRRTYPLRPSLAFPRRGIILPHNAHLRQTRRERWCFPMDLCTPYSFLVQDRPLHLSLFEASFTSSRWNVADRSDPISHLSFHVGNRARKQLATFTCDRVASRNEGARSSSSWEIDRCRLRGCRFKLSTVSMDNTILEEE